MCLQTVFSGPNFNLCLQITTCKPFLFSTKEIRNFRKRQMGGIVSSMNDLDTLPKRLQYLSEEDPNKELYVFYNRSVRDSYTSRELFILAGRFAHRLRQQGFQKGDVIANTLPNSPERLITDVGIVMAGCVTMNGQVHFV